MKEMIDTLACGRNMHKASQAMWERQQNPQRKYHQFSSKECGVKKCAIFIYFSKRTTQSCENFLSWEVNFYHFSPLFICLFIYLFYYVLDMFMHGNGRHIAALNGLSTTSSLGLQQTHWMNSSSMKTSNINININKMVN